MKKIISLVTALIILLFIIGIIVPHQVSKRRNFVGQWGHIYFDNSSGQAISNQKLSMFWYSLNMGTPSLFSELSRFMTWRIEIIQIGYKGDVDFYCGTYKATLFTFFNIKLSDTYNHIGCP